jgi:hypothetical protein
MEESSNNQTVKKIKTTPRLLLTLIKNEEWGEAEQLINLISCTDEVARTGFEHDVSQQEGKDENKCDKDGCMFTQSDSSGQIPLHLAIWKKAPDSLILQLINACEVGIGDESNISSSITFSLLNMCLLVLLIQNCWFFFSLLLPFHVFSWCLDNSYV